MELVNSALAAVGVIEHICTKLVLPGGRFTFSNGIVWYKYSEMLFFKDELGGLRDFVVNGVEVTDYEFFDQPWLVEEYRKILSAMGNNDLVQGSNLLHSGVHSNWVVETSNGWRVSMTTCHTLRCCNRASYQCEIRSINAAAE